MMNLLEGKEWSWEEEKEVLTYLDSLIIKNDDGVRKPEALGLDWSSKWWWWGCGGNGIVQVVMVL